MSEGVILFIKRIIFTVGRNSSIRLNKIRRPTCFSTMLHRHLCHVIKRDRARTRVAVRVPTA